MASSSSKGGPRPLDRLLADSFNLTFQNVGRYGGLLALVMLPGYLLAAGIKIHYGLYGEDALKAHIMQGGWQAIVLLMLAALVSVAFTGIGFMALTHAIALDSDGAETGWGEAFWHALARLFPFMLAEAMVSVIVFVGFLLLVIPGVIAALLLSMTHLAVLVEDQRAERALSRSKELVTAHLGKIVGNMAVAFVLGVVVTIFCVGTASVMLGLVGFPESDVLWISLPREFALDWLRSVIGLWPWAFSILLYKDLAALHPLEGAEPAAKTPEPPAEPGPPPPIEPQ